MSLSIGLFPGEGYGGRAGGTHPTGMHSFFVSCIRTQLPPDFRGVAVNETQKEWVATTLKRFLNCAFTKLSPEILEDWKVVFKSAASEGKSLMNCLKGKYETMASFIKPRFS